MKFQEECNHPECIAYKNIIGAARVRKRVLEFCSGSTLR